MTFAEIDLSAIQENIRAIRARVGGAVRVIPAVKANAYGHGAAEVSRACLQAGADTLGVAGVEEAAELRAAGIDDPILIMGCALPDAAEDIVRAGADCTVCDPGFAAALSEAAGRRGTETAVHIKVDTGMGRIGLQAGQTVEFARSVSQLPGLKISGVFTHFPCSDESERSFTLGQIDTFTKIVHALRQEGFAHILAHASNSGGILAYPEADFDAVRPGIMLYGHYPSFEVIKSIPIREALTLKTRIVYLKDLPAGSAVSYGRTHTLKRMSRVATIPIGYADGYNRLLSNRGEAAVMGRRVPVVGRVCMDQTLIDVTDVPGVSVGNEVTLYGGGFDYLSVSRIAEAIGTIPYELLCAIGPRVPRVFINP